MKFTATNKAAFKRAIKAVIETADTDMMPILRAAHVTRDGDCLQFTATDSYRLVRVSIPGRFDSVDTLDVVIKREVFEQVHRAMTAPVVRDPHAVEMAFDDESVTVNLGESATVYDACMLHNDYPNVERMLSDLDNAPHLRAGLCFSGAFLTSLTRFLPDKKTPVTLRFLDEVGRGGITWDDDGIGYEYMLMNVRNAELDKATADAREALEDTAVEHAATPAAV